MKHDRTAAFFRIVLMFLLLWSVGCNRVEPSISSPPAKPPGTEILSTEAIVAESPSIIPPVIEPPSTESPVTEAPSPEPPYTESPTTEVTTTEPPSTEPLVTEVPTQEAHSIEPPVTEPHSTEPPVTEPPSTEAPSTEPPVTEPPSTEPPAIEPPFLEPSGPSLDRHAGEEAFHVQNLLLAQNQVPPLQWSEALYQLAAQRAQEISTDYSHNGCPDWVGENILMGTSRADLAVEVWYESDGHRRNMLAGWTYGAVANYGHYWVAIFAMIETP